jgi:hypothetical protein
MPTRIYSTLDPNRLGPKLSLSQGNLIVSTTEACDIARAVFGTRPIGAGRVAFECAFFSQSQPAAGLVDLCAVGVAALNSPFDQAIGENASTYAYLPANADIRNDGISFVDSSSPDIQVQKERVWIGVMLDMVAGIVSWHVNGSYIGQISVDQTKSYLPAVSIGSSTPGDVSAQLNFGQYLLNFPNFTNEILL